MYQNKGLSHGVGTGCAYMEPMEGEGDCVVSKARPNTYKQPC
jgi:hypothetical protein